MAGALMRAFRRARCQTCHQEALHAEHERQQAAELRQARRRALSRTNSALRPGKTEYTLEELNHWKPSFYEAGFGNRRSEQGRTTPGVLTPMPEPQRPVIINIPRKHINDHLMFLYVCLGVVLGGLVLFLIGSAIDYLTKAAGVGQ